MRPEQEFRAGPLRIGRGLARRAYPVAILMHYYFAGKSTSIPPLCPQIRSFHRALHFFFRSVCLYE